MISLLIGEPLGMVDVRTIELLMIFNLQLGEITRSKGQNHHASGSCENVSDIGQNLMMRQKILFSPTQVFFSDKSFTLLVVDDYLFNNILDETHISDFSKLCRQYCFSDQLSSRRLAGGLYNSRQLESSIIKKIKNFYRRKKNLCRRKLL